MSTVNAGSPNSPEEQSGIPWLALLFGVIALIFVVLVGPGLAGALFAIMAPPEPPTPPGSRLLSYSAETYGVDTWTYDTGQDTCDLIAFFREQGGQCPIAPARCASAAADDGEAAQSDDFVATCTGDLEFSIFAMRWRFEVPVRSAPGPLTQFDLSRQIFWTGPPA